MAPKSPTLDALQRWLQAVITHPGGIGVGVQSAAAQQEIDVAPSDVEAVILPSTRQSSLARLAVYGNAYYLRLLECLREFFPCLTEALSRETFDEFGAGYLQRHPPASYTLQRLADRFVEFLAETQPAQDAEWAGFVIDLARLELAIKQVFDGLGPESDPWPDESQPASDGTIPTAEWTAATLSPRARLVPAPGLTLLQFQWPVSSHYTQWKRGEKSDWPQPMPQHVALLRRDYVVRRHELSPVQYALLSLLAQGMPIGQAVAQAAASDASAELRPDEVRAWMTQWAAERFFAGLATS
ncbi:MAG TPA: DNA-binding domain-containing protein [Pirellulaceae bacterium]|nr:DNA-binding domain-containing protein [Pirellulaceae bacterium]